MDREYVLYLEHACGMWLRSDLGPMPENPRRLAEVLREAGIEVYMCRGDWVTCEPRPAGIWEALTGKLADPDWVKKRNCPPEQPGKVLKLLVDKGIPVSDG